MGGLGCYVIEVSYDSLRGAKGKLGSSVGGSVQKRDENRVTNLPSEVSTEMTN